MKVLTLNLLNEFHAYMYREELSKNTIAKYGRDVRAFYQFLDEEKKITKEQVLQFKEYLEKHYRLTSANSMLASVNRLLEWMGEEQCRVKCFKVQRQIFCSAERELTKAEFHDLVKAARKNGNQRLEMILQTIGGTGIRIGELPYITVEAVRVGKAVVLGKGGKQRIIFLNSKLQKYLLQYCVRQKREQGSVFVTRSGKQIHRGNVWAEMKQLCEISGVNRCKVFPHNLRHLFARTCYEIKKDIVYLADILGHSNIETTRIYTTSSGTEHRKMLEHMRLVI